jgi:hypothetical protein
VPVHRCVDRNYILAEAQYGLTTPNFAAPSPTSKNAEMMGRVLVVKVDTIKSSLTFFIDGEQYYEEKFDTAIYPFRIGFFSVNGVTADIMDGPEFAIEDSAAEVEEEETVEDDVVDDIAFDEADRTSTQIGFLNNRHTVSFPLGPCAVYAGPVLDLAKPVILSFELSSQGNSGWCFGIVPVTDLAKADFLIKQAKFGVSSAGLTKNEVLSELDIHSKTLVVTVNVYLRQMTITWQGTILYEKPIDDGSFPCRVGFGGYIGTTLNIAKGNASNGGGSEKASTIFEAVAPATAPVVVTTKNISECAF